MICLSLSRIQIMSDQIHLAKNLIQNYYPIKDEEPYTGNEQFVLPSMFIFKIDYQGLKAKTFSFILLLLHTRPIRMQLQTMSRISPEI